MHIQIEIIGEYSQFGCRFTQRKNSSKDLCLLPAKALNWAGWRLFLFILHLSLFSSRQLWCGRNGSFCNTFMAKSDFWSSSLPRSLPRRKVKSIVGKACCGNFTHKSNLSYRWLLTMRLQNDLHLLLLQGSSRSTRWRTSREFPKHITRFGMLPCFNKA